MSRATRSRSIRWSYRIYRSLLAVLPSDFRKTCGPGMLQVWSDLCRAAYQQGGAWAVIASWPRLIIDLGITAAAEWLTLLGGTMFLKRIVDIGLAAFFLLLTAPLQLFIAVLIRLDSRGPIIFRQTRIGRGGRPFMLFKFRTMTDDDARRITRVGRRLRASAFDELPQLVNVLRGDMSLVGPRPVLPHEAKPESTAWQRLLAVPPGLTGPGQLVRLAGGTAEHEQGRNLAYIDQRSLGSDLKILGQTLGHLLRRR